MSLEFFSGSEAQEGMSEAAFEAFKQRMQAASAQIAASQKEEGKQRKNEDELIKILMEFVKSSKQHDLVELISLALADDLPAVFILGIILLGNQEIQAKTGTWLITQQELADSGGSYLTVFETEKALPIEAQIEINNWSSELKGRALEMREKLIKNAFVRSRDFQSGNLSPKTLKSSLTTLCAFVLAAFSRKFGVEPELRQVHDFVEMMLLFVLEQTQERQLN